MSSPLMFAETLSNGGIAGWTTFGLAGLILSWLFLVRLPANDKALKDANDKKDADMKTLLERNDKLLEEARKDFKASLDKVVDHCEKEFASLRNRGGQ